MPSTPPIAGPQTEPAVGVRTLGVVSFLNARPLYETLCGRDDILVKPAVPSRLTEMLAKKKQACEVALLPIVDYWRHCNRLRIISDACIASDGETLTVRVFSRVPPDRVRRLHVDGDSHTSVILARLVWLELYARRLELAPWIADPAGTVPDDAEAVMLIGDKVVRSAPGGFGFQVDLGAAWKHLTGLPFVFAAWCGPADRDHGPLDRMLREARDAGTADAKRIALRWAGHHGWPSDLAVKYLCSIMKYTLTDAMRAAMDRFFSLAVHHHLLS